MDYKNIKCSFIHAFRYVYSINNLCVPGTVLGAGDTVMNETGRVPALMRLIRSERETVSHRPNEESR